MTSFQATTELEKRFPHGYTVKEYVDFHLERSLAEGLVRLWDEVMEERRKQWHDHKEPEDGPKPAEVYYPKFYEVMDRLKTKQQGGVDG